MCWDIVLPKWRGTANGVRLKLNYFRRKDCLHSECMPGPDITRRRNKRAERFSFLRCAIWAGAAVAVVLQPLVRNVELQASQLQSQSVQSSTGQPTSTAPAQSPPAKESKAGTPAPSPEPSTQQQVPDENGTYVIRKDVDEVLLHATVVDDKQRIVTDLERNAFTVLEDGKPQAIVSVRHEDIPVAMGIVIDNSGSMREKRAKVNKAALNLVRASNPQDEVFVVNFSDEFFLDQPFTNKINLLQSALEKYETRGGTALYDAVVAWAEEL